VALCSPIRKRTRPARFVRTLHTSLYGQTWTLVVRSTPTLESRLGSLRPNVTLAGGLVLSFLLFGLVWGQSSRKHAIALADRMTAAYRQSANSNRLLIQNLQAGVVVYEPDGRVLLCNSQAATMLGVPPNAPIDSSATPPGWLFLRADGTPLPVREHPFSRVRATNQPLRDLVLGLDRPAPGERLWLLGNAFPEIGDDGLLRRIVVTLVDITERKHAEEALSNANEALESRVRERTAELAETKAMLQAAMDCSPAGIVIADARAKAELLREVNHRVKNNLLAILGLALAEQRMASSDEKPAARRLTGNLRRRIEGLLEVHQILSSSQWAPMPVNVLARQIIGSAIATAPASCQVTLDLPSPPVQVSPRQASNLALVLNELATNTVKYACPSRATVQITLTCAADEKTLRLEYHDTGPGYPDAVLRQERLSVGLSLVRDLTTRTIVLAQARFADLMELRRTNAELRAALGQVRRLSALLPICAACKRVRDEAGYWQSVEDYLASRSNVQFSHGLCEKCLPKHFPDCGSPQNVDSPPAR
jgi:two-component sensor histidine kinase/PAS domain-containing protein